MKSNYEKEQTTKSLFQFHHFNETANEWYSSHVAPQVAITAPQVAITAPQVVITAPQVAVTQTYLLHS
jgi:hypothetical protein